MGWESKVRGQNTGVINLEAKVDSKQNKLKEILGEQKTGKKAISKILLPLAISTMFHLFNHTTPFDEFRNQSKLFFKYMRILVISEWLKASLLNHRMTESITVFRLLKYTIYFYPRKDTISDDHQGNKINDCNNRHRLVDSSPRLNPKIHD